MIRTTRSRARRKRPELFFHGDRSIFLDKDSYITKGGRVRLYGEDYELLRIAAYRRAAGRCECGCYRAAPFTNDISPRPDVGEVSHNEHGARKSDELNRVKWMRHECHMKSHNCNGKPVPSKRDFVKG